MRRREFITFVGGAAQVVARWSSRVAEVPLTKITYGACALLAHSKNR